jgi:hypothetical protein
MVATVATTLPTGEDWSYEVKWDGLSFAKTMSVFTGRDNPIQALMRLRTLQITSEVTSAPADTVSMTKRSCVRCMVTPHRCH